MALVTGRVERWFCPKRCLFVQVRKNILELQSSAIYSRAPPQFLNSAQSEKLRRKMTCIDLATRPIYREGSIFVTQMFTGVLSFFALKFLT